MMFIQTNPSSNFANRTRKPIGKVSSKPMKDGNSKLQQILKIKNKKTN